MKISEVSARSGAAIPTIKYYVREGLLPPGERLGPVQTEYSEEHVSRLRLIRALRETGRLSIETVKRVLEALESPGGRGFGAMAIDALNDQSTHLEPKTPAEKEEFERGRREIDEFLVTLGWKTSGRERAAQRDLVEAFVTLRRVLARDLSADVLLPYARAMDDLARLEVQRSRSIGAAPADALRRAFLGTILFEPILIALRRIALGVQAGRAYREKAVRAELRRSEKSSELTPPF